MGLLTTTIGTALAVGMLNVWPTDTTGTAGVGTGFYAHFSVMNGADEPLDLTTATVDIRRAPFRWHSQCKLGVLQPGESAVCRIDLGELTEDQVCTIRPYEQRYVGSYSVAVLKNGDEVLAHVMGFNPRLNISHKNCDDRYVTPFTEGEVLIENPTNRPLGVRGALLHAHPFVFEPRCRNTMIFPRERITCAATFTMHAADKICRGEMPSTASYDWLEIAYPVNVQYRLNPAYHCPSE